MGMREMREMREGSRVLVCRDDIFFLSQNKTLFVVLSRCVVYFPAYNFEI